MFVRGIRGDDVLQFWKFVQYFKLLLFLNFFLKILLYNSQEEAYKGYIPKIFRHISQIYVPQPGTAILKIL